MLLERTNTASRKNTEKDPFRILLVEDDLKVARMMLSIMEHFNVHADHVSNNKKATHLASQQEYDLAIVDIHLGRDSGLELIDNLKKGHPNFEFITMTGDNPKSVETRVREFGVLYHLVKPFSINELTSVLRHTINRSSNKSVPRA